MPELMNYNKITNKDIRSRNFMKTGAYEVERAELQVSAEFMPIAEWTRVTHK